MDNQVDEIKNRLDIADVIRGYMKLEKSGANLRGLCPFHREKTPSFFVSPARQLWKCFGCSLGGDMFSFVQQIDGVEFKDALKTLADRAGVQLSSYDPKIRSEKTRLYEICEKACQFFEKQLNSSSLGKEAKQYLLDRKINEKSISEFRLGFAPDTKNGLSGFLREQGYSPAEIFKAGVAIQSGAGGCYDRFRGRIMFPIFDLNGQIIGFGGRIFFGKNQTQNPELAKYINTPQTLLYDKSKVVYGLDKAKMKIRQNDSCIFVEGYTDVIAAHQAGSENIVATSGTALTEHQLDIIKRYTENIITAFDMDVAGDNATKRGIDIAQQKNFNIKVITLPKGKDPAEIIQENEKEWKKAVENPVSIGDFYFKTAFSRYDKSAPEGMKNISNVILPMIKRIPSNIESSYWVQKLASEFKCSEAAVWDDLSAVSIPDGHSEYNKKTDSPKAGEHPPKKTKKGALYERLLVAILKDKKCLKTLRKKDLDFFDKKILAASLVLKMWNCEKPKTFSNEEKSFLDEILFQEEIFPTFLDEINLLDEFTSCFREVKRASLRENLFKLQQEMKGQNQNEKLLKKFQKTSIELAKL